MKMHSDITEGMWTVIEAYKLCELWKKYGLVSDLIVSTGSCFVFQ